MTGLGPWRVMALTVKVALLIPEPHVSGPGHLKQSDFSIFLWARGVPSLTLSPSPAAVADPRRGNASGPQPLVWNEAAPDAAALAPV